MSIGVIVIGYCVFVVLFAIALGTLLERMGK